MKLCEPDGNGICSLCGIPYADSKYARECRTLVYWLEQQLENKQQAVDVAAVEVSLPLGHGPGAELKKLLAGWPFRFVAGDDCKCNQRARYMDQMGCDWVEANIEECVGYLRESAADRGLPFLDAAGRLLIRRAISNARKASA